MGTNRIPKRDVNPGPSGNYFWCVVMNLYRFYVCLLLYIYIYIYILYESDLCKVHKGDINVAVCDWFVGILYRSLPINI